MDYRDILGLPKKQPKKKVEKKVAPKPTAPPITEKLKEQFGPLNEWSEVDTGPKRWSKPFNSNMTEFEQQGGKDNVNEGTVEVQDDFELLCWDFVSTPSTQGAFMTPKGRVLQEGVTTETYQYNNVNNIIRDIICNNTGMCKC